MRRHYRSSTGDLPENRPYYVLRASFFNIGHESAIRLYDAMFLEALTNDAPFDIEPSKQWSDDKWHVEKEDRIYYPQSDYDILQEGEGEGTLVGGHLSTLNLLQGTEFMPSLKDAVLFLEDDEECHPFAFDRQLQSLLHLPDVEGIKAIIIGRFQKIQT